MKTPDNPSTMPAAPVTGHRLLASGLRHRYDRSDVLRDVSIDVAPGEILCLVGPSGCGKSTLLRLIAGLERVQAGSIAIDGELIASADSHVLPERRDVGLVFQDFALFPHMSLADNVAFGLGKLPRAQRKVVALDMLSRVGLADRADEAPHVLSGGQQQRVALARALASRPRLMLLDEPFSNLDVRLRHRMRVDTLRLLKDSNSASVMVTHDPDEAMFMADRIALMNEGRIVQLGSPDALYRNPHSPFAAEFFGDVNRIDAVAVQGRAVTPLGAFDAPGVADGARVQVLLRPEAILVHPQPVPGSVSARVAASHMLGSYSLLELTVQAAHADGGRALTIQAQAPGSLRWLAGQEIHLTVNPAGIFVFPA
ncbi:ABC transporter ATP-binding protein [Uliginosibacterium sp. H1]|uniref:ABC transporter ATP-binding protein n=1 Tax=Uliginosibacterium sp. H1 TaxID=3114757 RepID=UPI002E17687A|nr:ABC transporter ATP-binding protein [Uliginosibacterium sp. H1]